MTYLPDKRANEIFKILKEEWGAETLLSELIAIMSDDLYEMYMETLGGDKIKGDDDDEEDETE